MMARGMDLRDRGAGAGAGEGKYPTDQSSLPASDHRVSNFEWCCHRAAELDRWGAEPDVRVDQFGGLVSGVCLGSQTRWATRAHNLAFLGTHISKSMRT